MTVSLTPALALDFICALSADIRAAAILDATGAPLAGDAALAAAARRLPDAPALEGSAAAGAVYAARDERHVIVVVTGPFALPRLTHHDLRTALSALGGQIPPDVPAAPLEAPLVSALLSAR